MGVVLLYLVSFVLGIAVPAGIVRYDVARLTGEQLARAWPEASLWSAVVAFGPLCLPVHFIRTRRDWAGVDLGIAALLGAMLLISLPVEGLAWLFEIAD